MLQTTLRHLLLSLCFVFVAAPGLAELSEQWQKMNRPVEPFRMLGNLYYVGASDIAAYLIATDDGHILIDGGFEETAPLIRASIETLGFQLEDVKILLNSHGHIDHAGGLARLKELTGARFMASEREAPILERGGLGDDLLGDRAPFPPIVVDHRLRDGEVVELGGMRLTAHVTAGHTRGCTSWAFEIEDGDRSYQTVSICSLSVLEGMKFGEPATYPDIAGDFKRSFERLESLACDVFLASHASFIKLAKKRERMAENGESPFVDPEGYRRYIERARQRFNKAVAKESSWVETIDSPQYFAVSVEDVDRAVAWYRSAFGLEVLDDTSDDERGWRIVNLHRESLFVEVIYSTKDAPKSRVKGIAKVGFRVPDVNAVADRVEQATGERPRVLDFSRHGVRLLQLHDPEDNIIQLTSPLPTD